MPKRCVVGGCSNTSGDGISLHEWPKEPSLAKLWDKFVQCQRKDWGTHARSQHSVICSAHFKKPDDFSNLIQYNLGITKRLQLKPASVPALNVASDIPKQRPVLLKLESAKLNKAFSLPVPQTVQKADASTQTDTVLHFSQETMTEVETLSQVTQTWEEDPEHPKEILEDLDYCPPKKKKKTNFTAPIATTACNDASDEQNFIISKPQLMQLFVVCRQCGGPASGAITNVQGTWLEVTQRCSDDSCAYCWTWESQPLIRRMPLINLMLTGATLISGAGYTKIAQLFDYLKIPIHSKSSFYRHQRNFVFPTVMHAWQEAQEQLEREAGDRLNLAGDCRSDSPGFCAKYGAYTVIESRMQKVFDIQVVQKNEAGSSNACELLGLQRCLAKIGAERINSLVTDRHRGIAKYLRENHDTIKHRYDLWHVAKSVGKKLSGASNKKEMVELGLWSKAIKNHLYFSVLSSDDDDCDMKEAKWLSVLNHVQGIHEHDNNIYPRCQHDDDIEREWIPDDAASFEKLDSIVSNTMLLRDIRNTSSTGQTSHLEAFHSLVIQFCPKSTHYSYQGMKCRMIIAALHFNENSSREQAETSSGDRRYTQTFSKASKVFVVKKIKTNATHDYGSALLKSLVSLYKDSPALLREIRDREEAATPASVTSTQEKPCKEAAIQAYEVMHDLN